MTLLLDTHVFIWWVSEPEKLSAHTHELCWNRENVLLLSVASAWDIQLKKLTLVLSLSEIINKRPTTLKAFP
jgi:PIN domain nuclease of toxin-antitoxin system